MCQAGHAGPELQRWPTWDTSHQGAYNQGMDSMLKKHKTSPAMSVLREEYIKCEHVFDRYWRRFTFHLCSSSERQSCYPEEESMRSQSHSQSVMN